MRVPILFEIENDSATGVVYYFCSDSCRSKFNRAIRKLLVDYSPNAKRRLGTDDQHPLDTPDGTVCRQCGSGVGHVKTPPAKQPTTAREIADAIERNSNAHHMTEIDRATWDAEQNRLWDLAAKLGCASDVIRIVAPSLRGAK